MSSIHPITDASVLAIDPALDGEKRLQSLLRLWYGNYFTGLPFTTRAPGGGTQQLTFHKVSYLWQEDERPENPQTPLLHTVFTNPISNRCDMQADRFGHAERWILEVMVSLPRNLSGTPFKGRNPDHVIREMAGQIHWLFKSGERDALSACGLQELRVESPPATFSGASWCMRALTASVLMRTSQAR